MTFLLFEAGYVYSDNPNREQRSRIVFAAAFRATARAPLRTVLGGNAAALRRRFDHRRRAHGWSRSTTGFGVAAVATILGAAVPAGTATAGIAGAGIA
jgi:hypothetical protein